MPQTPTPENFIIIEMTCVNNGVQSHYHSVIGADSTWVEVLDSAITPGLRAMGFNIDKEDLNVN